MPVSENTQFKRLYERHLNGSLSYIRFGRVLPADLLEHTIIHDVYAAMFPCSISALLSGYMRQEQDQC